MEIKPEDTQYLKENDSQEKEIDFRGRVVGWRKRRVSAAVSD